MIAMMSMGAFWNNHAITHAMREHLDVATITNLPSVDDISLVLLKHWRLIRDNFTTA